MCFTTLSKHLGNYSEEGGMHLENSAYLHNADDFSAFVHH